MNNLSTYIIEKLKINKESKNITLPENGKLFVEFLQLTDDGLIDAIAKWMNKYHVIDIVIKVNDKYLYLFKRHISIKWDGYLNQDIFKGESFLAKDDPGNFDILKQIINGSSDYSKLDNILLYDSEKDKIKIYGSKYGIYLKHEEYELIVLKKNKDENDE